MADPYKSVTATLGLSIPGLNLKATGLDKIIKKAVQQNQSMNQLLLAIYGSKGFKARFPGLRNADGTLRMTPSAYLQQETSLRNTMKQFGLGAWWYDKPADLGKYIAAGVTGEDMKQRLVMSQNLLRQNPNIVAELTRIFPIAKKDAQFGALGYLLNPGKATEYFEQTIASAQISAAARQAGFNIGNGNNRQMLMGLAGEGVTGTQATQKFMEAQLERPMLQTLARRFHAGELSDKQIALSLFHPDPHVAGLRQSLFAQEKSLFTAGGGFQTDQQGSAVQGLKTTEAQDR